MSARTPTPNTLTSGSTVSTWNINSCCVARMSLEKGDRSCCCATDAAHRCRVGVRTHTTAIQQILLLRDRRSKQMQGGGEAL